MPRLERVPPFWSKEREQGVPRRPYEETEYCLGFGMAFWRKGLVDKTCRMTGSWVGKRSRHVLEKGTSMWQTGGVDGRPL